ncbi:hypothetical protein JAO76_04970 [Pontibacter sp. BT310]|uniref:YbbR-like domain-containing protein n=1 Tax=Pontibacter populi TaxID=890055 RepID=A0ABS6X8Z7_9BACT|nr:hypothetical protein [Pontibacter sp. BT310]MBW3364382.1 hypothetical protein [Pontibacter populi]
MLLCFVAASTFWMLNALNKSYSTQTTYPVRFIYNEKQLVPLKPLPEEVLVNVTAKGWKLLRKALRLEVQPAEIYIRNIPRNNYLLGSALRPALVNAMDGLQLNFVVTDTLSFNFDSKTSRTVPLQLDPKQKLTADGFEVAGPVKLSPDSVTFVGPSSIVNKISSPFLVRLPSTNLKASAKVEAPVTYKNQELVKANIEETVATINIKNLVQEERQLLPELVNVPEGRNVLLHPASVIVRYQLFEDSVSLLNRESFKAVLNFANFNARDSTIVPELVQKPVGVRKVMLAPQRVKVILQK